MCMPVSAYQSSWLVMINVRWENMVTTRKYAHWCRIGSSSRQRQINHFLLSFTMIGLHLRNCLFKPKLTRSPNKIYTVHIRAERPQIQTDLGSKHSGCKTCKTSVQSSCRGETVLSLLLAAGSCWPGFWVLNLVYLVYSKPKASLNQNWLAKWTMWTTRELFKPPFLRELSKLFAIQRPLPPGGSDFDCNPFPKLPPPLMHLDILCEACL